MTRGCCIVCSNPSDRHVELGQVTFGFCEEHAAHLTEEARALGVGAVRQLLMQKAPVAFDAMKRAFRAAQAAGRAYTEEDR